MPELQKETIEAVWSKVCLKGAKPFVIGSIYRPPGKGSDLSKLDEICSYLLDVQSKCDNGSEINILGDFNCDMLKKTTLSSTVNTVCNALLVTQLINQKEYVKGQAPSLTYSSQQMRTK